MAKKSSAVTMCLFVVESNRYDIHRIELRVRPMKADPDGSMQFASDYDLPDKWQASKDIVIGAYASEYFDHLHGFDHCYTDALNPSVGELKRLLPLMEKIDRAISTRQRETEDYALTGAVAALVDLFDIRRVEVRLVGENNRSVTAGHMLVAAVGDVAKHMVSKYCRKENAA